MRIAKIVKKFCGKPNGIKMIKKSRGTFPSYRHYLLVTEGKKVYYKSREKV